MYVYLNMRTQYFSYNLKSTMSSNDKGPVIRLIKTVDQIYNANILF